MTKGPTVYACKVCADLYLSQEEADLCSPREDWPRRYPHRVLAYASAFGEVAQPTRS